MMFGLHFSILRITYSTTSSSLVRHTMSTCPLGFDADISLVKASTRKTPQPTPKFNSAFAKQGGGEFAGTPDRLSALRGACLVRDRHRCVVSRSFDNAEADLRLRRGG